MEKNFSIALDGPSGSGKSTVAKIISQKLNILYLDTGAMYRAVALKTIKLNLGTFDENAISKFIDNINLEIKYINGSQHTFLDEEDVSSAIREPQVSMSASNVSSLKCVRQKMVEMQRKIASKMSCVLDGRDIGSFVLPNADYKFFITASTKIRTDRRFAELKEKGFDVEYDKLFKEIEQRDYNDSHREFSPLKQADDAIVIDTSELNVEQVVEKILSYIK